MKEYVLSTGAEPDLNEIWGSIARDSIDAADHWIGSSSKPWRKTPEWGMNGRT